MPGSARRMLTLVARSGAGSPAGSGADLGRSEAGRGPAVGASAVFFCSRLLGLRCGSASPLQANLPAETGLRLVLFTIAPANLRTVRKGLRLRERAEDRLLRPPPQAPNTCRRGSTELPVAARLYDSRAR